MTGHIDQLVEEGLLRKVPDENDRRIIRVVTTPDGRRVRDEYREIFENHIKEKLSLLNPDELEDLYNSMKTIKKVVFKFVNARNTKNLKSIKDVKPI